VSETGKRDLLGDAVDIMVDQRHQIERLRVVAHAALEIKNSLWYEPSEGTGACFFCDTSLHPNVPKDQHGQLNGDPCIIQKLKEALDGLKEDDLADPDSGF
jgi:hypothetical protein